MTKYLFGGLIGILLLLGVQYIYNRYFLTDTPNIKNNYYLVTNKDVTKNSDGIFNDLKIDISNKEEKINSINKRIDDLYILGGIIVTLLLAISVAIYIRAGDEVAKHMTDNYKPIEDEIKTHQTTIGGYVSQASRLLERIKINAEASEQKRTTDSKPPQGF